MTVASTAVSLKSDFELLSVKERLSLLLEFSENLPQLPPRYSEHPDLLERVEECQSPIYLFVEVEKGTINLFFSAPPEAPTTRGFAGILHEVLDSQPVEDVLGLDDDFPSTLSLGGSITAKEIGRAHV